jgi:hypothetical protein
VFIKLWSTDSPVARGGFARKRIKKISTENFVSDTKRMRNTPIHVCVKTAFLVDLQQKVGEFVLYTMSCPSNNISYNSLNECTEERGYGNFNVSPAHLSAFLGVGNERGPHLRRPPVKRSAIAEINIVPDNQPGIDYQLTYFIRQGYHTTTMLDTL